MLKERVFRAPQLLHYYLLIPEKNLVRMMLVLEKLRRKI
jgi:hypothetical protein